MTDTSSASAAREDLESVDSLTAEKLRLEIEELKWRRDLERKKLAGELDQLREAPARARKAVRLTGATALLSAITTLIVALVSGYITLQVQRFAQRQHESDTYSKLLQDLGSDNTLARSGAIAGLAAIAEADSEKSPYTVKVLASQLDVEKDLSVLRTLIPAVVEFDEAALDEVVRVNRSARTRFAASFNTFIVLSLQKPEHYQSLAADIRVSSLNSDIETAYSPLRKTIDSFADFLNESEARASHVAFYQSPSDLLQPQQALSDLYLGLDSVKFLPFQHLLQIIWYLRAQQDPIENLFSPEMYNLDKALSSQQRALKEVQDSARVLFVSSLALGRIIEKLNGKLDGHSLKSIALLTADLNRVSLSGADLSDAFIAGDAAGASFEGAKLVGANLSFLSLRKADLSFSDLSEAQLPLTTGWRSKSGVYKYAKLDGANWWDSMNLNGEFDNSRFDLKEDKSASTTETPDCGDKKPPGAPSDQPQPSSAPSAGEESKIILSLSFCFDSGAVTADRQRYESAFPRAKNEQVREDWRKRLEASAASK